MEILRKENLLEVNWFTNCGIENQFSFYTSKVPSVSKAIKYAKKTSWENTILNISEDARIEAKNNEAEDYRLWNSFANEYRQFLKERVNPLWLPFIKDNGLGDDFTNSVNWDLMNILLLNNYRGYISDLSFFDNLGTIYISGRFPCGYKKRPLSSKGYLLVY